MIHLDHERELLWLDHTTCYRGVSDKMLDHLESIHWNLVQASNSESKLNLNVSCMWVWDVDVKGQTISQTKLVTLKS